MQLAIAWDIEYLSVRISNTDCNPITAVLSSIISILFDIMSEDMVQVLSSVYDKVPSKRMSSYKPREVSCTTTTTTSS